MTSPTLVYRVPATGKVAHLYPECVNRVRGRFLAAHLSVTPLEQSDAPLCRRCLARQKAAAA